MTKRKAIEAAMERLLEEATTRTVCDEHGRVKFEGTPLPQSVEKELKFAFVAGLREAARWVETEGIDRSDGTYVMLIELAKAIRKEANRLAKKARAK